MSLFLPRDTPPPTIDNEITQALKYGYPPHGWEGDERLELAWNREEQRFELWRLEDDGQYHLVCRNRPGQRLVDMNLIKRLVEMDRQRGYDPKTAIDAHNDKIDKEIMDQKTAEYEQVAEKLKWAVKKDMGEKI